MGWRGIPFCRREYRKGACAQSPLGASDPRTADQLPPALCAGLRLTNSGLGPAAITKTRLTLDGVPVGELDESGVNRIRDTLTAVRPAAVTLGGTQFLATDYDEYLLKVEDYDPAAHGEFADLLRRRPAVEIHYESLDGGEKFMTALTAVVDPA